jgi:hypothetical protein
MPIGMGRAYSWKEDLMKIVQDRMREHGEPGMSRDEVIEVLGRIKDEIDETLGMIYNTLRIGSSSSIFCRTMIYAYTYFRTQSRNQNSTNHSL